jgi:hypothetical protein
MQRVRVRFLRNVLGYKTGEIDWVDATPLVEQLVERGYLRWLDAPAPETDDAPDWYLDDQDSDEVVLPSGQTIPVDELMDRLAFEDDGGAPFDQDEP